MACGETPAGACLIPRSGCASSQTQRWSAIIFPCTSPCFLAASVLRTLPATRARQEISCLLALNCELDSTSVERQSKGGNGPKDADCGSRLQPGGSSQGICGIIPPLALLPPLRSSLNSLGLCSEHPRGTAQRPLRNPVPLDTSALLLTSGGHAQVRDANSSQLEVTIWDSKEQRGSSGFMGECILNLSKLVPFQVRASPIFMSVGV